MTWLTVQEFQQEFRSPPSADTIRAWARRGDLELWQPGGPRGKVFVRYRRENVPETEQALLEALDAAQAEKSRKRHA